MGKADRRIGGRIGGKKLGGQLGKSSKYIVGEVGDQADIFTI